MSLKAIPLPAGFLLDLYKSAGIAAEARVFLSSLNGLNLANVEQDLPGQGTLILDNTYQPPTLGYGAPPGVAGADLVVFCEGPMNSPGGPVTIQFNVTFATPDNQTIPIGGTSSSSSSSIGSAVNGTATAVFRPSRIANDQNNFLPQGMAVDLLPDGVNVGNQILSVNGIASITNGAPGNYFGIMALPDRSQMYEVSCVTKSNIDIPSPKPVAIACRFDPGRWIKAGRGEIPKLELTGKHGTMMDGLGRYAGFPVTACIERWKADQVLCERVFMTGTRLSLKYPTGDGDAEVEMSADGMFEKFIAFI